MKKILSILLAVLLLASVSSSAFAEGYDETYEENGMTLHYTDLFEDLKGAFYTYPAGYDPDEGIGVVAFWYLAMPQEEADVLLGKNDDDWTDADRELFRTRHGEVLEVVSIDGGRGLPELLEVEAALELSGDWFTEIGKAEDTTFFAMVVPEMTEEYLEGIDSAYQEEFIALREELLEVLKNGEYFKPVVMGADLIGTTLRFETTDMDGNVVKSEDIFKENAITMVNVWATWCSPCIGELAELSEMNKRLAEKNAAVVGICMDADTEMETCRALIRENGVEYRNLLPFDGIEEALEISAFPTSFFVDSEGTILSLPFVGAPMEMSTYEDIIDSLLAGDKADSVESGTQSANDAGVYRVIVTDEEGNLVKGAVVKFCSDTTCTMGTTDENGVAEFSAEEGHYTIHILKVPAGYQKTSEEIRTDAVYSDIHFVLKKA